MQKLKQIRTHGLEFFVFAYDLVFLTTTSLQCNCNGTYELLACIGSFCNKTRGLDAFLVGRTDVICKKLLCFFEGALDCCARIKSLKVLLDRKLEEGRGDLILTLKAVTSYLALRIKRKSNAEYFQHPEHAIVRTFACWMMAAMRLSGYLLILNDPQPQIFEFSSVGKITSAQFYEDYMIDPSYKDEQLVACANSVVWGTGCSSFGCPVSVRMSILPQEAMSQSLHAYGDHEYYGSLCCCWECFRSIIPILLAEGAIESAEQVKGVTYTGCPFVFIAPCK
jgi:hypothetical protein